MVTVEQVDVSGLGFLMNGINHALIGTGGDGDLSKLTKDETRLLAVEIAGQVGPRTQAVGEKKIKRDVAHFLTTAFENIEGEHRRGDGVTWITAGPHFLTGVRTEDYFGDQVDPDMIRGKTVTSEYQSRVHESRPRYVELGTRGSQHVRLLDRMVVSQSGKAAILARLYSHVGRMKASFMATAIALGHTTCPQWIRRHIPSPKSILDQSQMTHVASPSITFGSTSRGVGNFKPNVKRAVKNRAAKMKVKLRNILFGISNDVHAKRVPRSHFRKGAD
jgi:hypothetical protein